MMHYTKSGPIYQETPAFWDDVTSLLQFQVNNAFSHQQSNVPSPSHKKLDNSAKILVSLK